MLKDGLVNLQARLPVCFCYPVHKDTSQTQSHFKSSSFWAKNLGVPFWKYFICGMRMTPDTISYFNIPKGAVPA
jgi:hypothetical protein